MGKTWTAKEDFYLYKSWHKGSWRTQSLNVAKLSIILGRTPREMSRRIKRLYNEMEKLEQFRKAFLLIRCWTKGDSTPIGRVDIGDVITFIHRK